MTTIGYFLEQKPHEVTELVMSSTVVLFYILVSLLLLKAVNAQCWLCHTSMKRGEEVLTRLVFWVQAGHFHSGMDNIAMAGVSSANVPPYRTIGWDAYKCVCV